jgi:sugar (pentulose or hexulose) kinase
MGDACVGLVVLGEHGSPAEASRACVRIGRAVEPNPDRRALYGELFSVYRDLYRRMKPVFQDLRALRDPPVTG